MKASRKALGLALLPAVLIAALAQSPARPSSNPPATLRIGLWTLWHDKEITVSPTQEGPTTFRLCETCAASPLTQPIQIRANEARLAFADQGEAGTVWLAGPVTLTAHGE